MKWLIPTFYGDMKIVHVSPKLCELQVTDATPQERAALEQFAKVVTKRDWRDDDKLAKWLASGGTGDFALELQAPVEKAADALAKLLKPGRALVSAVRFSNGRIEQVTESTFDVATTPTTGEDGAEAPSEAKAAQPTAATTVAAPTRGCPPPDFSPAALRARECLMTFLTEEQQADFLKYNRFISIGATTGHRYMLTSRTNRDDLSTYQRTLYDLDEKTPLCVHDWDIPPEEELHALNVMIQLPGHEHYLRHVEG